MNGVSRNPSPPNSLASAPQLAQQNPGESKYGHRFPSHPTVNNTAAARTAVPGNALKGSVGSVNPGPADQTFGNLANSLAQDLAKNPVKGQPSHNSRSSSSSNSNNINSHHDHGKGKGKGVGPHRTGAASATQAAGSAADEEAVKKEEEAVRGKLTAKFNEMRSKQIRLATVQAELDKLESTLQKDVRIIRGRIEEIDRELSWSRRNEAKLKKQWEEAKKKLTTQEELKAQLSQHLATIVSENETRKMEKLKLLADQLEHLDETG